MPEKVLHRRVWTILGCFLLLSVWNGCSPKSESDNSKSPQVSYPGSTPLPKGTTGVYLRKATGTLKIYGTSTMPTYQAYFHIPIAFEDQAPVLLTIDSPNLIDYRFLRISPPNVIVAARLKQGQTVIQWTSWVVVKANEWTGVPSFLSLAALKDLPAEMKPWLGATACVQAYDPFVQMQAGLVAHGTTDLMVLADQIAKKCGAIGWSFSHSPYAFDAFYALNWGNSCTGHAHAGAALFRAQGVPARVLLNIPTGDDVGVVDQHWIIQYYVPKFGWVRMETAYGTNMEPPQDELITMACAPEDEFPAFYPDGIEGYWHVSDPAMPWDPAWGGAHEGFSEGAFPAPAEKTDKAIEAATHTFNDEVDRRGLLLSEGQEAALSAATAYQNSALASMQEGDVGGLITNLDKASAEYETVDLPPLQTVYSEDFEGGAPGWTHGGTQDSWMLGQPAPTAHPPDAHSGTFCYGNGFGGGHPANADSWLLSPAFDLRGLESATLSFWLYNWVLETGQHQFAAPLWGELSTDGGTTFQPICDQMGGVNEDPAIPGAGGWTRMSLDLTPFIGNRSVQVRFRFQSGPATPLPGSYLDDILVAGRPSPH